MHDTSMESMRKFVKDYGLAEGKTVVDVGSYDINGTYKPLFEIGNTKYIGADIVRGPNVDILVGSEKWRELKDIDAVISGQTLEHVEDISLLMSQIREVLKPGGLICLIAPSCAPPHEHPIWAGNFSIKRMSAVVIDGGFDLISCHINHGSALGDCIAIATKPKNESEEANKCR